MQTWFLGKPFKFTYASRNFTEGLSVTAKALKPDNTLLGSYSLIENTETGFEGTYYFNLSTSQSDPEGTYQVVVQEGTYKAITKVNMAADISTGSGEVDNKLIAVLQHKQITASVSSAKLNANITTNKLIAIAKKSNITANVISKKLTANVRQNKLIATIARCA